MLGHRAALLLSRQLLAEAAERGGEQSRGQLLAATHPRLGWGGTALPGQAGRAEPVPPARLAVTKPTTHHNLSREVLKPLPHHPGKDLQAPCHQKKGDKATEPSRGITKQRVQLSQSPTVPCPVPWQQ